MVEHNLAKVRVASSSLVFRSKRSKALGLFFLFKIHNRNLFESPKMLPSILYRKRIIQGEMAELVDALR